MLKEILNKMSKKKGRIKMEGPQEIKIRYEQGKMIFGVGGREFFLSEEVSGSIFGRSVGLQFERVHSQDADFGGLRSLENYVRIARLMRKGLGMDQVAKVLNVSQERLRQFYGSEASRPQVESFGVQLIENERARQAELEMDFCLETPRAQGLGDQAPPELGLKFIDLLEVRNLRRQGLSDEGVADHMALDRTGFYKFLELNGRYLELLK